MAQLMQTVTVRLAQKTYAVQIQAGLMNQVADQLLSVWQPRQIALVSDTNVAPLYLAQINAALTQAGYAVTPIVIPAGESSKSLEQAGAVYAQLAAANFTRQDGVLALGGGVVGDLAGFIASTYMRGIGFVQMPTSLLAQVDSSVGGKTALDLPAGKNLIGSFYQPDLVLIDPNFLTTLSKRQLVAGYAEIVKMAALNGGTFWTMVTSIENQQQILAQATTLIGHSIAYKAAIVMADEKESYQRQLLNFGHTFGHAIETLAAGRLMHGEAVSIGMVALQSLMEKRGLTTAHVAKQLASVLQRVGLPITSDYLQSAQLYPQLLHDKKNQGHSINLVDLDAIGKPQINAVELTKLRQLMALD